MTRDKSQDVIGSEGVHHSVFEEAYARDRPAPWETGRVQPAVLEAIQRGWLSKGPVLDSGCGTGENAIEIVRQTTQRVHAVDCVSRALAKAKERASAAGFQEQIQIDLHDLRNPQLEQHRYGSILDAGVLHVFSDVDRVRYLQALGEAIRPGGSLVVIVFSDDELREGGPRRYSGKALDDLLMSTGWTVSSRESHRYETHMHPGGSCAWLVHAIM